MDVSRDFSISSPLDSGKESGIATTPQMPSDADIEAFQQVMERSNDRQQESGGREEKFLPHSGNEENATAGTKISRENVFEEWGRDRASMPTELRSDEQKLHALFEERLRGKVAKADPTTDAKRESQGDTKTQGSTHGVDASLIESLFKGMSMPGNLQTAASTNLEAVVASSAPQLDAESIETLVSRILVNSPEKGSSEVRLTLHDNILKGAEISITRDLSGNLSVSLSTKDPVAFQTLVASRSELLENLEKSERGTVSVEVRDDSSDEGNMQRRSRGLDGLEDQA